MDDSDNWNHRSADLSDGIRSLIAELDDLSFDILREAARSKAGRPTADKKLMQARRALEKAAHILGQTGFGNTEESEAD